MQEGSLEKFVPSFEDGILRKSNQEVYKKIIKRLSEGNKVLFEQATGTGKSYVAYKFLLDHCQCKKALFVSPSNAIDGYFIDGFIKLKMGKNFEIGDWNKSQKLKFIKKAFDIELDTCLYHGLKNKINNHYNIIIFDEVHRIGAKTWGPSAEILMKNNENANIIGMTATLDRPDAVDVKKYFDGKEPVSTITLAEALKKGSVKSNGVLWGREK